MDGMLSQDEISALLDGMDLSNDNAADDTDSREGLPEGTTAGGKDTQNVAGDQPSSRRANELLTDEEKDAIGEVANISMGSSATTLYSLVSRKVNITTPVVTLATWTTLMGDYEKPCVFIQIKYTKGINGSNLLVLKEHDVKVIADLMMGGDGTNTDGELGDMHLSAIAEAMNQMMGAAATSLSTMLKTTIDISPPEASRVDLTEYKDGAEVAPFLGGTFVKIAFRMHIEDVVDSMIMQLYPIDFARHIIDVFFNIQRGGDAEAPGESQSSQGNGQSGAAPFAAQSGSGVGAGMNVPAGMKSSGPAPGIANPMAMNTWNMGANQMNMNQMGMNKNQAGVGQMGMNQMNANQMNTNGMGTSPINMAPQMNLQNINVQPAQFQSFSGNVNNVSGQENIGLIMDVPLEVTVELGRTTKSISEILDFAPGTIIELDRIAGEPIDVLVNGKSVAKGEVVVIEASFGVRVTEIIK